MAKMRNRQLTIIDACEVSGYNRDQLKGLLKKLPQFTERATLPRVARKFTPQEIAVLRVIFILEDHIGINRSKTISVATLLSKALSGPKKIGKNARLFISFDPISVHYDEKGRPDHDGVILSLGTIFERVDQYLMPSNISRQADLKLGPMLVTNEAKKSVA